MTSSESPTFVRRVLVPVGIFVLGAAAAALLGTVFVADEDDRPPIIVSNGSVHVEVSQHGGDGKKGDLNVTGKRWSHAHPKNAPTKMELSITGGLISEIGCGFSSSLFVQKLTTATINFTYGPADKRKDGKLEFELGKKGVEFTVQGTNYYHKTATHAVDFGKNGTDVDEKATMTSVEWKVGNSNPTTCIFGVSVPPQVTILQRK